MALQIVRNNKTGIVLFLSLLILACCDRKPARLIIHPIDSHPGKLIPSIAASADESQIYSQIYETLLNLDADGKTIVPGLASRWAYVDGDSSLKIELKKEIPFHDGSVLDANAAKESIKWLKNNTVSPFLTLIANVEVVDKYTIKIHLSRPDSRFLFYLASRMGIVMISPVAIGNHSVLEKPAGTGPFIFAWRDSNDIVLSTFSKYRRRAGNVSTIVFRYFPYSEKLKKAFIKKEVDIVYAVDGYSIDRIQWSGEIKYLIQKPNYIDFLGFNLKNRIAGQRPFREAVRFALDLKKINISLNRGGAIWSINPLSETYSGFEDIQQPSFNIGKAEERVKKLHLKSLAAALYYPTEALIRTTYIEVIKSELAKTGLSINVSGFNRWDQYSEALKSDSAALFLYGWKIDILGDAGYFLYSLFYSKSPYNIFKYKNPVVDRLLIESQAEFNSKRRQKQYRSIISLILKDIPVIFSYQLKEYYAYNAKKIKMISMSPYGIIDYKDVIIEEN